MDMVLNSGAAPDSEIKNPSKRWYTKGSTCPTAFGNDLNSTEEQTPVIKITLPVNIPDKLTS